MHSPSQSWDFSTLYECSLRLSWENVKRSPSRNDWLLSRTLSTELLLKMKASSAPFPDAGETAIKAAVVTSKIFFTIRSPFHCFDDGRKLIHDLSSFHLLEGSLDCIIYKPPPKVFIGLICAKAYHERIKFLPTLL
jgi:hypothetical protein